MSVNKLEEIKGYLTGQVLGSDEASDLLIVALLGQGHILIEGAPGLGKTSLAQSLAQCFGGGFNRVQFTADMLPSDILGYQMYRQDAQNFEFVKGPVFTNMLLADEINRASPRVQSALLEAMNEKQVTIDGKTMPLEDIFLVIATQNDAFATGTFPLPEPQLDRFLLSVPMTLPESALQKQILLQRAEGRQQEVPAIMMEELIAMQRKVQEVGVSEALATYIVDLCDGIRALAANENAVSVRASIAVLRAAQSYAFYKGSAHVLPDHVQYVFPHVLRHRILVGAEHDAMDLVNKALRETAVA